MAMAYEIKLADNDDEVLLQEIMLASEMDLVGDIEDHVIIRDAVKLYGGALLYQLDHDLFHLLTIAVSGTERSAGLGSRLLQSLLHKPWQYCYGGIKPETAEFRVTTVARGSSRNFYLKNGFSTCSFTELKPPFATQCQNCPDDSLCQSAAMVFVHDNSATKGTP